jgi:hypothetical protein
MTPEDLRHTCQMINSARCEIALLCPGCPADDQIPPCRAGDEATYHQVGAVIKSSSRRRRLEGKPGYSPADGRPGRMFMHRRPWAEHPVMPPTGSSGLPWRWHPRPSCMLRGARHPGGEADRWSRCRGRAAGTPAGTSGCPPGLEDVLRDGRDVGRVPGDPRQSGAREGHQPGIIQQGPGSGRWPAPRASLWSRPGAVQVAGAQEDAAAWSVRVPVPASR